MMVPACGAGLFFERPSVPGTGQVDVGQWGAARISPISRRDEGRSFPRAEVGTRQPTMRRAYRAAHASSFSLDSSREPRSPDRSSRARRPPTL